MPGHSKFRRLRPQGSQQPTLTRAFVVWYTGSVMSLASIANDILIIAFGVIETDLGLDKGEAGLMMAFFFLGSGSGQMVFGPLSDYIGRRKTIIICVCFFLAGTAVVYTAQSLYLLLVGRLLQGIGCSMCQSVARALLRDLYSGKDLALQMARSFSVFAISPVLMPILGAVMLGLWGWRAMLFFHAFAGVMVLLVTVVTLRETVRRPRRLTVGRFIKQVRRYFYHRQSGYFTIPSIFSYTTLILMLSHTPGFLMTDLGISPWEYALIFSFCIGFAILPGQSLNRWLIHRFHILPSSLILSIIAVTGQGLILLCAMIYGPNLLVIAAAMFLFSFLALAQTTNFSSLCINPHPRLAGFVSSLQGLCSQALSALLCLLVINPLIDNDPWLWIVAGFGISVIIFALVWFGRGLVGEEPGEDPAQEIRPPG